MPTRTIYCSICRKAWVGYDFAERMQKLRRHYKSAHPAEFRKWGRNPLVVHPQAIESLKRYKDDLKAGHRKAAEYWRGQAGAYFTANPFLETVGSAAVTGIGIGAGFKTIDAVWKKVFKNPRGGKTIAKKSKVFNGKRYFLWNSTFKKGVLTQQAKKIRKAGLRARVITIPDKYAPRGKSYELYVYGSIRDYYRG